MCVYVCHNFVDLRLYLLKFKPFETETGRGRFKMPTNVTVESLPGRSGADHSAGLDRTAVKMTHFS